MSHKKIFSSSPEETISIGEKLARYFSPGDIVCLIGDLGSGKTTMVKGIAKGLKISQTRVNSPTFVLMNVYEGKMPLYHFDLYRLEHPSEILPVVSEEFLYGEGISIIEWADKMGEMMPEDYLKIQLEHGENDGRIITITPVGRKYKDFINRLSQA